MTYEGQIDEQFGIQSNFSEIPCEALSSNYTIGQQPTTKKISLTNEDFIFKAIRNKPYESLGYYFRQKAMEFEEVNSKVKPKDLKELEASVRRIKDMNIPVAKPLVDQHCLICGYMKT